MRVDAGGQDASQSGGFQGTVLAQPAAGSSTEMQRLFDARYDAWKQWVADHPEESFSSIRTGWEFNSEPYRQLVALGPRSVPCILPRLRGDMNLLAALQDITGVRLHERHEALAPGKERWTVDELPGLQWSRLPDPRDIWFRWWKEERPHTSARFEKLYAERQTLLQQGDAKGAQEKYELIQDLGIPVLPCLVDKIGQGATDLVPILSALTKGAVKPDASPKDCAEWWNGHEEEWTLPSATPAPAKPAAQGEPGTRK